MAGSKRGAPEGDGKKVADDRSARVDAVLQAIQAGLKQLLKHWFPLLQELGYFSNLDDGSPKVLLQVEVVPPFVCILSLCSKEPLERLSPREREVLRLVRKGRSTKEIATELRIKSATVETYIRRLYGKFGVHSRVLLSQHARLLG